MVSLNAPRGNAPTLPAKGERLKIGDIGQKGADSRVATALRTLAAEKAPTSVSQLVMWNVSGGLDWATIDELSRNWANPQELALAKRFVERLGKATGAVVDDPGVIYLDIIAAPGAEDAASALKKQLEGRSVFGLKSRAGVPERPDGPGLAVRIKLSEQGKAAVSLGVSTPDASGWEGAGSFTASADRDGAKGAEVLADRIARGLLEKLVKVHVTRGGRVKGKDVYVVKIENTSPLVLNGLAVAGSAAGSDETPKTLSGLCVPPRRTLSVPATLEVVETLGLRKGARASAADFSGL